MTTVKRKCVVCGKAFSAQSPRRVTCSSTCRSRKHRGAAVIPLDTEKRLQPADGGSPAITGVYGATYKALVDAERLETPQGQAALVLARRIDAGRDTGSAMATMTRQLRETLAEALKGARREGSKLDELTERRRQRLHRGA